jgi:REase_MTES_1575/Transcriptional regulator, AbiEi antitoxin
LNSVAAAQLGLFTTRQARTCGLSTYQIRRRIESGQWRRVAASVIAPTVLPLTAAVRDRAAQLAVPGSVLAGPSAARSWGINSGDARTFLIVSPGRHPRFAGARLLYDRLDRSEVWIRDGAAVTSRPRTIVDCLRVVGERDALHLLERSLQEGWIGLDELTERVRDLAGRRGTPRLAHLVGQVADGSRSAAERRTTGLLKEAGIAGWAANVVLRDDRGLIGVGDVVFEEARVVIELDGWAYHVGPRQFQRDRERQNRLVAAGWTVLRFTWRDLTERRAHVVATITSIVGDRTGGRSRS